MSAILGRYRAVLLDMNSTFMFGEDRFGPTQDYGATYRGLGGKSLDGGSVRDAVTACCEQMAAIYEDPSRTDSFPQVIETLRTLPQTAGWAEGDLALVERVIAAHELGRVPGEYADGLRCLAATHRLGLVANIWSRKEPWLEELRRVGVLGAFAACVFSSDGPSMKPSPVVFKQAIRGVGYEARDVVFVGDSLRCDICGASAVGLDTVWVDRTGGGVSPGGPSPTFVVRDLLALVRA